MFPLLLTILTPSLVASPVLQAKQLPTRVGHIFIVGDDTTPIRTILGRLPLFPGRTISVRDGATITRHLSGLRLLGIRAKWSLVEPGPGRESGAYRDIAIKVEETWLTVVLLGPQSAMDALLTRVGSCVNATVTYCFGEDPTLVALVRLPCDLLELAYRVAPTSTLLAACGGAIHIKCMVYLLVGVPEALTGMGPVLGASSK